ncbi:hypothetical protein BJY01DRAFT_127143 [Aspergillus pseudoustus]|uniref:Uncharacterized protein n=1 Tax=Aspergillus pseudoustus TaxID=1810923 RepID=A0ABR4IMQ4_9EURO
MEETSLYASCSLMIFYECNYGLVLFYLSICPPVLYSNMLSANLSIVNLLERLIENYLFNNTCEQIVSCRFTHVTLL